MNSTNGRQLSPVGASVKEPTHPSVPRWARLVVLARQNAWPK